MIGLSLLSLVFLDVLLSMTALFFPQFWFTLFHGVAYVDPEGLLPRSAAMWVAFALFQTVAFLKWKKEPVWLAVVAGLRLGDIFTDWTYLFFAHDVTRFAWVTLALASPANLFAGSRFLKWYRQRLTGAGDVRSEAP